MLRSATKQTRRVLSRARTNPTVAHSVRHHSAGGAEGALLITPTPAIVGSVVGIGGGLAYAANYETKQSKQRQAEAEARHRFDNTTRMFDEWFDMSSSRRAVLHKRYNRDGYFNLHKLVATTTNKSTIVNTKPVPESVADVMRFFIEWEYYDNNKTIDSADLKEYLGSEFYTIHKILTEIRDEEAKSWHKTDLDRLDSVVDFLDKISERKTEG